MSSSSPSRRFRSIGSSLISTPGPIDLALRCNGKIYQETYQHAYLVHQSRAARVYPRSTPASLSSTTQPTFVPLHPNRNAASCAKSSPNPSINPLTNGSSRFIAAPLSTDHIVGGEYRIIGLDELEGGSSEESWVEWFAS